MKKILLITMFAILFATKSYAACTTFKYHDHVRVISGFYEGLTGVVTQQYDACTYSVILDEKSDSIIESFDSKDLVKISGK